MGKKNVDLEYLRTYSRKELIVQLQGILDTKFSFHNIKHYDLMMILFCLHKRFG